MILGCYGFNTSISAGHKYSDHSKNVYVACLFSSSYFNLSLSLNIIVCLLWAANSFWKISPLSDNLRHLIGMLSLHITSLLTHLGLNLLSFYEFVFIPSILYSCFLILISFGDTYFLSYFFSCICLLVTYAFAILLLIVLNIKIKHNIYL